MTKRFIQALRLLLGKPLIGRSIDGTMLLDVPLKSEFDYSKEPPFELAFHEDVPIAPPAKIVCEDRFRVCVFQGSGGETCRCCGRELCWLVLELRLGKEWFHLITMHETKLSIVLSVLTDVAEHLESLTAAARPIGDE
jgi:hypothetical protein